MHSAADRSFRIYALRIAALIFIAGFVIGFLTGHALARDDGQFANSPLKSWFDKLASGNGLCCSFADGRTVADPDWGTMPVAGADGKSEIRYWVVVDGQKIIVPPSAVVTEPNKFGQAVVWPYQDATGVTQIRCFIPGSGA